MNQHRSLEQSHKSTTCGTHIIGFYIWSKQHTMMSSLCGCFSKHSDFEPLYTSNIPDSSDYDDHDDDEEEELIQQNASEPDFNRYRRNQERGKQVISLFMFLRNLSFWTRRCKCLLHNWSRTYDYNRSVINRAYIIYTYICASQYNIEITIVRAAARQHTMPNFAVSPGRVPGKIVCNCHGRECERIKSNKS